MKCGTTSLFDHLVAHPQISGCNPKEPGYFAFDEKYARGDDWYESLFDFDPTKHKVALDGSTDYSKFPYCDGVTDRIEQYGAQPKLLYVMRHPLRRIESHARHVQFKRRELGQTLSSRDDHSLDSGISDISMNISMYAKQIDQYETYFRHGKIKLLTLEELSRRPRETMEDTCDFLDVDRNLLPESFEKHNMGAEVRRRRKSHPLWQAMQKIGPLHTAAKVLIPASVRYKLRAQTAEKVRIEGRFQLTPSEEEKLLAKLSSDLRRLRDFYGVDIEHQWGIDI